MFVRSLISPLNYDVIAAEIGEPVWQSYRVPHGLCKAIQQYDFGEAFAFCTGITKH
jgi:hypothetical protein